MSPLKKTAAVFLVFTLLVFGFNGCGGDGKKSSRKTYRDPFEELDSSKVAFAGRPVNTQLFYVATSSQGSLRGSLKPVQPVVIRTGNTSLKRIALTLDDGWNADMRILELLKAWDIKFTTFLIGGRGVVTPGFLQAIQDAGGEICNHTLTHSLMQGRTPDFILSQIWQAQDNITHTTHRIYPYIRYLGGSYDKTSVDVAAQEGFYVVNWNLSDGDTVKGNTPDRQIANVLNGLSPGSIILCHWGGYNTYEVLCTIIPEMQRRGYEVTSLTRVLEGTPYLLQNPTVTVGK